VSQPMGISFELSRAHEFFEPQANQLKLTGASALLQRSALLHATGDRVWKKIRAKEIIVTGIRRAKLKSERIPSWMLKELEPDIFNDAARFPQWKFDHWMKISSWFPRYVKRQRTLSFVHIRVTVPLSPTRARLMHALRQAQFAGTDAKGISGKDLMHQIGSKRQYVTDLSRYWPLWNRLIEETSPGYYRLLVERKSFRFEKVIFF
jgi:hypothetical protein